MNIIRVGLVSVFIIGCLACQKTLRTKSFEGGNVSIDSALEADSAMNADIIPYKNDVDGKMNRVIGASEQELNCFKPESPLSNFVSDIIQQNASKFLVDNKADSLGLITLVNIKGIRAPIPKGDITVRNVFELMPFENEIIVLRLSGDSILSLINFLGKTEGDGVAGLSVVYEQNKTKKVTVGGKLFDKSKNYYLATSDYLANGGDHYSMIMNPIDRMSVGLRIREAIIEHIENIDGKGAKVSAEVEGRVVFN